MNQSTDELEGRNQIDECYGGSSIDLHRKVAAKEEKGRKERGGGEL